MKNQSFDFCERCDDVSEWRSSSNGLQVLLAPTAVAPVVSFGVVYRVGSRNEGRGQTGATHLLEHLMFKGTREFNRQRGTEIARVLQRVGAAFNATTWLDRTSYFETLPVEHLPLAARLEADRMRNALVSDEDLASERTVVLNELDMAENEPFELLFKGLFSHAYLKHPYRHPTIGWRKDVVGMTGETLRGFYDAYYHPDNATVIVAGDVEEEQALAEIERFFGEIGPSPVPPPGVAIVEPAQYEERRFTVTREGEMGYLALGWHIPEARHRDVAPLIVTSQVLSEGVMSRLNQRLVDTSLCLGVNASAMEMHDPGLFQVVAVLAPGTQHQEVEEIVRSEIRAMGTSPPATDEVARARTQTRTDLAFRRESPAQLLGVLTEVVAGGDWRMFATEMDRVSAVTRNDVSRVCDRYLVDGNLTAGWFVPGDPKGEGGRNDG